VTERRYWDIAWELFPQSGAVQVLPRPGYTEPASWTAEPREIDGHVIAPKVVELFSRPVRDRGPAAGLTDTVHCIGSLSAGGAERQLVNFLIENARTSRDRQTLLTVYPLEGAGAHYAELLRRQAVRLARSNGAISEEGVELIRRNFEIVQAIKAMPFSFNAWVLDLWVELSLLRPRVAHLWLDHPNIWGGVAAVLAGVPGVLLSTRNVHPGNFPYLHCDYMRPWYRWMLACPQVRMLNNSRAGAASYADWLGIEPDRIDVVLNGVNLDHLQPSSQAERASIRAQIGLPDDAVAVVGAFRLSDEKRPALFVETFARAHARYPHLHAVLMGDGPAGQQVDALVARHGLQRVFHRLGNRSDLAKVMSAMDIFLHTAMWEGTPNVVLEAQQLCLPIVATDAGGSADAIADGVTGFCVPKDDEQQLAVRLCEIVADLAAWRERAKAGPGFVGGRFALPRMAEETRSSQQASLRAAQTASPPPPEAGFIAALRRTFSAQRRAGL
jgi:glycosyltransferase involved in cell wall biosynthesis